MIELLKTVFDVDSRVFALKASRKEYFRPRYDNEIQNMEYFLRGWTGEREEKTAVIRAKYKRLTGYDYK